MIPGALVRIPGTNVTGTVIEDNRTYKPWSRRFVDVLWSRECYVSPFQADSLEVLDDV